MSRYKIQKALARPVWLPMRRQHYRNRPYTFKLKALYPRHWRRLQSRLGGLRTAPLSLAVATGRWFQRGPEQLLVTVKSVEGTCQLEMGHAIRRPKYNQPFTHDGKRRPDQYFQSTKPWRYCLDNPEHARAFWELLNHSCSYAAGQHQGGRYRDLYHLDIGQTKELARWRFPGLWCCDKRGECLVAQDGHEILEVLCIPGERPRRPKAILGARPSWRAPEERARYDRELEHWHNQMRSTKSKRLLLRLRRVDVGRQDAPAFFLNDATELDLSLFAIQRLSCQLPAWWKLLFAQYEREGNQAWPRVPWGPVAAEREYTAAQLASTWTERRKQEAKFDTFPHPETGLLVKVHKIPKWLQGLKRDHRQFRWESEVMRRTLQPWMIEQACRWEPQPGLFLLGAAQDPESQEQHLLRLALWDAQLLRWSPHQEISEIQAARDWLDLQATQVGRMESLVRCFLLVWAVRRLKATRQLPWFPKIQMPSCTVDQVHQLARGPPR